MGGTVTLDDSSEVSIAEAAELTGVGVHTLRYYEGQQLLEVPRTASGRRRYGPRELAAVRFIAQLRKTGMPIGVIREYAAMVREGTSTSESRLRLLEAHRATVEANLAEQQEYLRSISTKIAAYRAQLNDNAGG
jgi:DNA-binding transcriptional MerR regulator